MAQAMRIDVSARRHRAKKNQTWYVVPPPAALPFKRSRQAAACVVFQ